MGLVVLDSKRLCAVSIASLVLAACTGAHEAATTSHTQALEGTGAATPERPRFPVEMPLGERPEEPEAQLDERAADGARLFGAVLAAPLGGDPERVLRLRAAGPDEALTRALAGRRALDAHFVDEGVVILGTDHVLRYVAGGIETELDADAQPPLSVAATRVAYARGEMPVFALAIADVRTGAVETLADELAPVWSPALSEDGRSVVFVSSATGRPRLARLDADGAITLLASARFPTSPRAPRWLGSTLTFEDEGGLVTIDVAAEPAP